MKWIDTPLLVYSRVEGHPAERPVQEALATGEWASSVLVFLEVYQTLRRNYGLTPREATEEVLELAVSPIRWFGVDIEQARLIAARRRDSGLDGPDAALLILCAEDRGVLFSLDARLLRAATAQGLAASTLIDQGTMDRVRGWEEQNLPERGLPRFLRAVERWMADEAPDLLPRFNEATSGLTRLPV